MSNLTMRALATVVGAGALTLLATGVAIAAPAEGSAPAETTAPDAAPAPVEAPAALPAAPASPAAGGPAAASALPGPGGTPVWLVQGLPPVPIADPTLGVFDAAAVAYNLVDGLR